MLKILRALFVIALLFVGGYSALRLMARPARAHAWFTNAAQMRKPLVFAHQGGEAIRPSNTMLAFDHAVALGAEVLDGDVHITRDGELILMHDEAVDRTTNGRGQIEALTLAQIQQLDAAHTFSIDDGATFPYRATGVTVPTVEDVFKKYPAKLYGLEIKQTPPAAAATLCELIRKNGMQERVLVSAFKQESMDAFRATCPEVATSATQDEATLFVALSLLRLEHVISPRYESLQVPEARSGIDILTPRFMQAARNRGLAVQPWTINSEADLRRVVALGVDGINTDFPDRLIAILKSRPE